MSKKEISMVLLNYNDANTIITFIDNLEKDILKLINLIIVDNFSTDKSFELLKNKYDMQHDILITNKNNGYSAGNNYGIQFAIKKYNPKYIVISNPDVYIKIDTIMEMLKLFDNKNIKLVGCKMLATDGKEQTYGWKLPNYSTFILSSFVGINRLFLHNHKRYRKSYFKTNYSLVEAVTGSFFIVDKTILAEVNFFDEDVFLYCEEDILGYKLKQCNYQLAVLNSKGYIHNHSQTISKTYNRLERYMIAQRSRKIFLEKYMKCGKFSLYFYGVATQLGCIERKILEPIYNLYCYFLKKN